MTKPGLRSVKIAIDRLRNSLPKHQTLVNFFLTSQIIQNQSLILKEHKP